MLWGVFSFFFFSPIHSLGKNPGCQLSQSWKKANGILLSFISHVCFQMPYQCAFLLILRKVHRNCKPMVVSSAFYLNNTPLWFLIVGWQSSYYPMFLKMLLSFVFPWEYTCSIDAHLCSCSWFYLAKIILVPSLKISLALQNRLKFRQELIQR